MYGNSHADGYQFSCVSNPELVLELLRLNGHSQPQETTDHFARTKRLLVPRMLRSGGVQPR